MKIADYNRATEQLNQFVHDCRIMKDPLYKTVYEIKKEVEVIFDEGIKVIVVTEHILQAMMYEINPPERLYPITYKALPAQKTFTESIHQFITNILKSL